MNTTNPLNVPSSIGSKRPRLYDMFENCNDCLCPGKPATTVEFERDAEKKAWQDNEAERRRLIKDLEKAGVTFPVTELEAMASPRLLGPRPDSVDIEVGHDEDPPPEASAAEDVLKKDLTSDDYATNMPEDLKDLLRRYYQLEAEREVLKGGTTTAPNSESGENEPSSPLESMSTPRAPSWFFRKRSYAIADGQDDNNVEERSGNGDDESQASLPVTVVYRKERTLKIRFVGLLCCLVIVALSGLIVYFALYHEKGDVPDTLQANNIVVEASPVPQPTSAPCTPNVEVSKECFVRGEQVVTKLQNCNSLPDDWLGVYQSNETRLALGEDSFEWMYTCGNKQCRGVVQSNLVTFQLYEEGSFRIHLIRNADSAPFEAYASTSAFQIVASRLDCPDDAELEDVTADP